MINIFALADLKAQAAAVRPEVREDFERLCRTLEDTRDAVRDFLDSMPQAERQAAEFQLMPHVDPLLDRIRRLTDAAHATGVIDKGLATDLGWLAVSLRFVAGKTRFVRAVAY